MTQEEYYDMKKRAVALQAAIELTCCLGRGIDGIGGDPQESNWPTDDDPIQRLRNLQEIFLSML